MSVIKIKNESGEFVDIPVIKGDQGIQGEAGNDGVSITTASSGTSTQSDGYTITPITFNKSDGSNVLVNVQAKNGIDGQDGSDGADGTSVSVIQATDENNAISLSTQNPNNIYFWSE